MSAQSLQALDLANIVKASGTEAMNEIRVLNHAEGRVLAAAMLRDDDPRIASIRLDRFLRAIHRIHNTRAGRFVTAAELPLAWLRRPVRRMTLRQRGVLADVIERGAA